MYSSKSSVKEISINFANKKIDQFFPFSQFLANQILSTHSENINLVLDFSKNDLLSSTIKKWFQQLVDKLVNANITVKIQKLILHNNLIDKLEFINQKTLKIFVNLTEIYLESNFIQQIPQISLLNTNKLQRLTLNSNEIKYQNLLNIIEKVDFSELRVLGLANVKLKKAQFMAKNKTLKKLLMLDLINNDIKDINLSRCTFQTTLYQLQLGGNMLTLSFIGVNKFQNLSKLDLSNNKINSAQGLQFLQMNTNLSVFKLSSNNICNDRFFGRLNCKKLKQLELRNNKLFQLTDKGLRRAQLTKLNHLELNENIFSGQFIKEIMTGLQMNEMIFLSVWNRQVLKSPKVATFPQLKKNVWKDLKYYDYS